ncbi:hypothetical protein VNO78_02468 [Psophocarpus tetragonolobus]|uniref:Uncharacterized protein n=1 Tax=Psophocarpus tetragonolobus TaxID=3891 RepID=A0AAN9TAS0_PSOTE
MDCMVEDGCPTLKESSEVGKPPAELIEEQVVTITLTLNSSQSRRKVEVVGSRNLMHNGHMSSVSNSQRRGNDEVVGSANSLQNGHVSSGSNKAILRNNGEPIQSIENLAIGSANIIQFGSLEVQVEKNSERVCAVGVDLAGTKKIQLKVPIGFMSSVAKAKQHIS